MNGKSKQPFVLFADDHEDTLRLMAHFADTYEWNYDLARNVQEIIDFVNLRCSGDTCYDAIVADVNYYDQDPADGPRRTGIMVAREIRKVYPNVPIIFVSAFVNGLIKEQVRAINGADILSKPIDYMALFKKLDYLISFNRAASPCYEGPERRKNSVNLTMHNRRASDKHIHFPQIIETIIGEVKEEARASGKG